MLRHAALAAAVTLTLLVPAGCERARDESTPPPAVPAQPGYVQPTPQPQPQPLPAADPGAVVAPRLGAAEQRVLGLEQRVPAIEQNVATLSQQSSSMQQQLTQTQAELRATQAQVAALQAQGRAARRTVRGMVPGN